MSVKIEHARMWKPNTLHFVRQGAHPIMKKKFRVLEKLSAPTKHCSGPSFSFLVEGPFITKSVINKVTKDALMHAASPCCSIMRIILMHSWPKWYAFLLLGCGYVGWVPA